MESYEHLLHFVYNGLISDFFLYVHTSRKWPNAIFQIGERGQSRTHIYSQCLTFFKIGGKLKAMSLCYIFGTTAELVICYMYVQGRKWPSTKVG